LTADWLASASMLSAWRAFVEAGSTTFTIPGHKRRAGLLDPAWGRLLDADVPLYGGVDTVKLTAGVLADAEARAAVLWGADWCRFSTGGSTHANQSAVLALGRPGDTVLVSRTAHRSTLLGLVLAGLSPVWIPSTFDDRFGIPAGLSMPHLEQALLAHPDAVGLLCVEPSYLGTMSDMAAVVKLSHEHDVPVIVDQAWGAHLGFAPGYPDHAFAHEADAMITSAHKTLPAFSQASLLLARTERLDPDRLVRGFEASFTTSPAGAILTSIDASRALLASPLGGKLLTTVASELIIVRERLRAVGLVVPGPEDYDAGRFDPAKLVLCLAPSGRSGLELEQELLTAGIGVEMADRDTVVPIVTMLDDAASLELLTDTVVVAIKRLPGKARPIQVAGQWGSDSPQVCSPREAFFGRSETVTFADAPGRVSAEVIAPYPPGVPVLVPGEMVTAEALERLRKAAEAGLRIAYAADPTLATIRVLAAPETVSPNAAGQTSGRHPTP
jgi:arginine decarboxylase